MRNLKITQTITSYSEKSFSKYLEEVSKIKLLSGEEEALLGPEVMVGNRKAINKLVVSNLRFVISVANQHVSSTNKLVDLVNEGNLGLIHAANKFDYTKGFKFISFAVWWIRKYINEYIDNTSRTIRLPINKITTIRKIKNKMKEMEQDIGREPNIVEVLELYPDLGLGLSSPEELLVLESNSVSSYDAPVGEGESETMANFLPTDNLLEADYSLISKDRNSAVNAMLAKLGARECTIMEMSYGINYPNEKSTKEVADYFGMTRESIRQIKIKTLRKLNNLAKSGVIKEY